MTVTISALICTRNRAGYLRRAIESVIDQTLPLDQYEIIVVDNASEDSTPDVIGQFSDVPQLRSIREPVIGLSRARNTAWQHARGTYVAYMDDDAIASREWLEKYLAAFQAFEPMPGSVGGKCEPIWEVSRPPWLSDHMLSSLSICNWSDVPVQLGPQQWLPGCNIAYPVRVLRELGGFREDLGRTGGKLLSGEETFLQRQLDARGYVSIYHPDIIVRHHISSQRLTKPWFRQQAFGTGLSAAIMLKAEGKLGRWRRAQLSSKRIVWMIPRILLRITTLRPADRFRRECQAIETFGYLKGLWSP